MESYLLPVTLMLKEFATHLNVYAVLVVTYMIRVLYKIIYVYINCIPIFTVLVNFTTVHTGVDKYVELCHNKHFTHVFCIYCTHEVGIK